MKFPYREKDIRIRFFVRTAPVVRPMERLRFLQGEKCMGVATGLPWLGVSRGSKSEVSSGKVHFYDGGLRYRLHRSRLHFHIASQESSVSNFLGNRFKGTKTRATHRLSRKSWTDLGVQRRPSLKRIRENPGSIRIFRRNGTRIPERSADAPQVVAKPTIG